MEVDLSQELQAPTRPILQTQVEAAWRGRAIGAEVRLISLYSNFNSLFFINYDPPLLAGDGVW